MCPGSLPCTLLGAPRAHSLVYPALGPLSPQLADAPEEAGLLEGRARLSEAGALAPGRTGPAQPPGQLRWEPAAAVAEEGQASPWDVGVGGRARESLLITLLLGLERPAYPTQVQALAARGREDGAQGGGCSLPWGPTPPPSCPLTSRGAALPAAGLLAAQLACNVNARLDVCPAHGCPPCRAPSVQKPPGQMG